MNGQTEHLDETIAYLLGVISKLTQQLDLARDVAANLESECDACWGPAHTETMAQIRTQKHEAR